MRGTAAAVVALAAAVAIWFAVQREDAVTPVAELVVDAAPPVVAIDAAPRAAPALPVPVEDLAFPSAAELMGHVDALAGEALRGRMAGTADERRAASYVREQLEKMGLEVEVREFEYHHYDGPPWPEVSEQRASSNIIGWIPGTDSDLRGEYIVIGAHYDHLGVDAEGALYLGADDNASGVAGLLGIAAAWSGSERPPRRSVALVFFGAEEQGLRGSQAFVDAPPRPLARITLMINLDMIGKSPFMDAEVYALAKRIAGIADGPGVGLLGDPEHPELASTAHAAAEAEAFALYADSDFSKYVRGAIRTEAEMRGDHAPFMRRGVPYLWLSTSMHDDYHLPGDTTDKIDATVLRKVARIAYRVALAADASE